MSVADEMNTSVEGKEIRALRHYQRMAACEWTNIEEGVPNRPIRQQADIVIAGTNEKSVSMSLKLGMSPAIPYQRRATLHDNLTVPLMILQKIQFASDLHHS